MQKISIKSNRNVLDLNYTRQVISIDAKQKDFTVKTTKKTVKVDTRLQKVSIRNKKQNLIIDTITRAISINVGGKRGLPGPAGKDGKDGLDGVGVPRGGLPGQLLVKTGAGDYESAWATITGTDKYYVQNFLATTLVLVEHNLLKYPAVTVHDSAGDEVVGEVEHLSVNMLRITFSAPFSGIITCN